MKTIAIDFDGVIHDYKNPIVGRRMGGTIAGAQLALRDFKSRGYKIIIFTVWGDEKRKQVIADFMKWYVLPFDEITNIKPQADYYVDDKAVRFTNWKEVAMWIHGKDH